MPDDPHFHEDGSFVLFAEQQVDRLVKVRTQLHRTYLRILGVAVVLLIGVATALGYFVYQQHETSNTLHTDVVKACQAFNYTHATEQQVWDSFIALLLQGNTNPADHARGAQFEAEIAKAFAAHDCGKLFQLRADSMGPEGR